MISRRRPASSGGCSGRGRSSILGGTLPVPSSACNVAHLCRDGDRWLRLDEDGRPEAYTFVHLEDVGIPHTDAAVADGLPEELRIWGAAAAKRATLAVGALDTALPERRRPARPCTGWPCLR